MNFSDYASEYSRNLSVSEQKNSQKSPYSWGVDRSSSENLLRMEFGGIFFKTFVDFGAFAPKKT